jgi:hypothetical protein
MIAIDVPTIKKWEIQAHEKITNWLWLDDSHVELEIKDLKFDLKTGFYLDRHGYLDPNVYDISISFGSTSVYHDSPFVAAMAN